MLIYGVMFTVFALGTGLVSVIIYQTLKERSLMKKSMTSNHDRVKKFKEDGGMHKWTNMAVRLGGKMEETYVCEHTGYCPKYDGFVPMGYVEDILSKRKLDKEFQEYKRERLLDFADEYCIGDIKGLYAKIISLKKDFHIDKMNKFKAEIKEKFGDSVTVVTDINDLANVIKEKTNGKS